MSILLLCKICSKEVTRETFQFSIKGSWLLQRPPDGFLIRENGASEIPPLRSCIAVSQGPLHSGESQSYRVSAFHKIIPA